MSDAAIMMIPLMGMFISIVVAVGYYMYTHKSTPTPAPPGTTPTPVPGSTPVASLKTLTDGQIIVMSVDGRYFSTKFDAKASDPTLICSGTLATTKASATKLQATKVGTAWQIKPDCDGDTKYTSYLTDEVSDIVQKKVVDKKKAAKQTWNVDCQPTSKGCTVRSVTSKRYLASNASGLTLATATAPSSAPVWSFEAA